MVSMNGYLIFYPRELMSGENNKQVHTIEIDGYGGLGGENASCFNVFVNDSIVAGFKAQKRKKKYDVKWKGKLTEIDSIMVQFVNAGFSDLGYRSLFIKGITIDKNISVPYQNHSEYNISKPDGNRRIVNNFSSYAQLARRRLLTLGVDSSLIIAVPGKDVKINRTLTSALAFRDWLKTTNINIKGINIITVGTHASRTLMTYNKILKGKYNIGIISLPDYNSRRSGRSKILKTLREAIGIIYYWFLLIPYQ
jgi:hypothetical protein